MTLEEAERRIVFLEEKVSNQLDILIAANQNILELSKNVTWLFQNLDGGKALRARVAGGRGKGENMKRFNLNVDDEFRVKLRDGASHVAVEYLEFEEHCNGDVVAVGTKEECDAANYPTLVVVPVGATAHFAVWGAEHVAPLLAAEQESHHA